MPARGWKGYEPNEKLANHKELLSEIDPKAKGSISESYVALHLAELGFDVWMPYMNNHRADMAVVCNDRLIRIQVKSAMFDVQHDRFRVVLTTKDKTGKHIGYRPETQDFFIVKCQGLFEYYVIPCEIGLAHPSLNLYPHRDRIWRVSFDVEEYRNAFHLIKDFDRR